MVISNVEIIKEQQLFQRLHIPSINGFLTVIQAGKKSKIMLRQPTTLGATHSKSKDLLPPTWLNVANTTAHLINIETSLFFWPGCRGLPCPGHHWLRITINSTCQHRRLPDICCGIDLCLPNPNGGEDWNRDTHLPPWWKTEMRYVQNRRGSAATISEHLF